MFLYAPSQPSHRHNGMVINSYAWRKVRWKMFTGEGLDIHRHFPFYSMLHCPCNMDYRKMYSNYPSWRHKPSPVKLFAFQTFTATCWYSVRYEHVKEVKHQSGIKGLIGFYTENSPRKGALLLCKQEHNCKHERTRRQTRTDVKANTNGRVFHTYWMYKLYVYLE